MAAASLVIRPLTPDLMDAMGAVTKGSWGATCWCLYPRMRDAEFRNLPGDGPLKARRRAAMAELAGQAPAPGLLAFRDDAPVGWIALGPRAVFRRVAGSRATPAFDDLDVWVIPCVTVARAERGQGVGIALIEAAADYARDNGAPAIEAYPRAGAERVGDDSAYFGTEAMFRRAGFDVVRGPLPNRAKNWTPRVVVRRTY